MRFLERFEHGKYDLCIDLCRGLFYTLSKNSTFSLRTAPRQRLEPLGPQSVPWIWHVPKVESCHKLDPSTWVLVFRVFRAQYIYYLHFRIRPSGFWGFIFFRTTHRPLGHNGENGRLRTDIQKTLEIEQVFVPSQYLAGARKHVCGAPNALKTS